MTVLSNELPRWYIPWAAWHTRRMNRPPVPNPDPCDRFPAEIISHGVWLSCRVCLSDRDIEALMANRGVTLTYEAVRYGCRTFGPAEAKAVRRRRSRPGDTWPLAEVFRTIQGPCDALGRAVDQDGNIRDLLGQHRREKMAAQKFFRKLLKGLTYVPRMIMTDQRPNYGAAKRELRPSVEHRQHRYRNNRAETSHQPTRQREWRSGQVTSPGHAQRVLCAYGLIASHFRPKRHRLPARAYRQEMTRRFQTWQDSTGTTSRIRHECGVARLPPCAVITSGRVNLTVPPGCRTPGRASG